MSSHEQQSASDESLSDLARDCEVALFQLETCFVADRDPISQLPIRLPQVRNEVQRFQQWLGTTGALRNVGLPDSLDERMGSADHVKAALAGALKQLGLSSTKEVVDEQDSSSSSSISIDSQDDEGRPEPGTTLESSLSEIEELLLNIRQRIDSLFRWIIFIRQYAAVDERTKALKSIAFPDFFDIQYIKDRFSDTQNLPHDLAIRLGEANARRRQYFRYCRDHYARKESATQSRTGQRYQPLTNEIGNRTRNNQHQLPPTQRTVASTRADTEFTKFNIPSQMPVSFDPDQEPARSMRSIATSVAEDNAEVLSYPPLPEDAATGRPFLCDLCFKIIELSTGGDLETTWRKHVLMDLEPYVCTFAACDARTFASQRQWFEHEMNVHRCIFSCHLCADKTFQERSTFKSHLQAAHDDKVTEAQSAILADLAKRPKDMLPANECPLCDGSWAHSDGLSNDSSTDVMVTPAQFRKHLGYHLLQVALFSIPRNRGGDGEVDSGKVQVASPESKSPSGLSTENKSKASSRASSSESLPAASGIVHIGSWFGSAPLSEVEYFIGRTNEMLALEKVLRPGKKSTTQQRVVLEGTAGIGKTQLAIAYARRYETSYTSVLWLNATTKESLEQDFDRIKQELMPLEETIDELGSQQTDLSATQWLSHSQNTQWLLILDNYSYPDGFNLEGYIPSVGHGSLIITTNRSYIISGHRIRVGPMRDLQDSLAILQARSQRHGVENDRGARELATRLGGLPFALTNAGTLLQRSTMSFDEYLQDYQRCLEIKTLSPVFFSRNQFQGSRICDEWDFAVQELSHHHSAAVDMIRLLAYFDNQKIWYGFLVSEGTDLPSGGLQLVLTERTQFERVMKILVNFCLVEEDALSGTYMIQNCVHDWLLTVLNSSFNESYYWYAMSCVDAATADDDWDSLGDSGCARIAPHAVRCAHVRFEMDIDATAFNLKEIDQTYRVAELLMAQEYLSEAERMYKRALTGYEKELGSHHIKTLDAVNNLGNVYADLGRAAEAQWMYERAVSGYVNVLGQNHTSTLDALNNLGVVHAEQDRLASAMENMKQALNGYENWMGREHPRATIIRRNLESLPLLKPPALQSAEQR